MDLRVKTKIVKFNRNYYITLLFMKYRFELSRFTWIYFLKHPCYLYQIYITFANVIKTQFSRNIKTL